VITNSYGKGGGGRIRDRLKEPVQPRRPLGRVRQEMTWGEGKAAWGSVWPHKPEVSVPEEDGGLPSIQVSSTEGSFSWTSRQREQTRD
jgi:hypothetical protein